MTEWDEDINYATWSPLEEHKCEGATAAELEIRVAEYPTKPNEWIMIDKFNYACEIVIQFCPFCGTKLKEVRKR